MPEVGDSGLVHYRGIEATSDSYGTSFLPDLDDSYEHTHFVYRGAYYLDYAYPFYMYVYFENNDAGSWDTGAHYNRGVCWGYGGNRYGFGDNRQSAGLLGAIPCVGGGTASFSDNTVGWIEGTIWNHSDSDKATTITYRSGLHNDSSTVSNGTTAYNYWYWGWLNYRVATKATAMYMGNGSYYQVQGSRLDLWGVKT